MGLRDLRSVSLKQKKMRTVACYVQRGLFRLHDFLFVPIAPVHQQRGIDLYLGIKSL